ncbi:hypothetical protein MMC07_008749 [Pseudocyphellaria aurata]|nr:hypothetical protein [Pseudocyphellaria aurata]
MSAGSRMRLEQAELRNTEQEKGIARLQNLTLPHFRTPLNSFSLQDNTTGFPRPDRHSEVSVVIPAGGGMGDPMNTFIASITELVDILKKKQQRVKKDVLLGALLGPEICCRCVIKGGKFGGRQHVSEWTSRSIRCTWCTKQNKECVRIIHSFWEQAQAILDKIHKVWRGNKYCKGFEEKDKAKKFNAVLNKYRCEHTNKAIDMRMEAHLSNIANSVRFTAMMAAHDHCIPFDVVDSFGAIGEIEPEET